MLELWYSNDLAELLSALVENLEAQRDRVAGSIFETIPILVPNRTVETYLKLGIASRAGIAANLTWNFLTRFLAERVRASKLPVRLLERAELEGWVLSLLLDGAFLSRAELAPVRRYVFAAGSDPEVVDLRRHQLSVELAGLFEEYDYARPELLESWPLRALYEGTAQGETEAWQRRIWLELFGRDGRLLRRAEAEGVAAVRLGELFKRVKPSQLELPSELHLFGFSYVGAVFVKSFAELASATRVNVYALNPSQEYWEDVGIHPSMRQLDLFPRSGDTGTLDSDDEDPLYLSEAADTPALRLWGRPGRESIRLLNALTESDFNARFVDPIERGGPSLLHQLQRDILVREPERQAIPPSFAWKGDASLRVLACPSLRREVESIAGQIWSLIAEDETLRFNQIAVLVNARQAEAYQAHLAAAFRETHELPYNMIDLPLGQESRIVEAIELLLALPLSRFRRQELLRVVTHPAVAARFVDADPEEWLDWCDALGIVHGADHRDHQGTYIERDLFNWDQGLRRLALGVFMTGQKSGNPSPVEIGAERYLPEEVASSRLGSAGRLGLLVRSLIADARFARSAELSFSEWARLLGSWLSTYLAASTPADERVLRRAIRAIQDLERADAVGAKVGFRIASERARGAIGALRGGRGQHLADGVVVSAFLPMRAIPFRVVFVAGLGEGKFPASERPSNLDLRSARRRPGDVSPRERDKYMFLETLLSARDKLVLSYVARDELTGEPLEPSGVVLELLEMLERGYLPREEIDRAMIVSHRLRRYDPDYFPELFDRPDAGLGASSLAARREAQALALGRDLRRGLGWQVPLLDPARLEAALGPEAWAAIAHLLALRPGGALISRDASEPGDDPLERVEISLAAIRRFLECPLQGWARFLLRLPNDDGEEDVLAREDEQFATHPLDASIVLRETFLEGLKAGAFKLSGGKLELSELEAIFARHAEALELSGVMPTAVFKDAEREGHLDVLAGWWRALHAALIKKPPPGEPLATRVYRFGKAEEHAEVDELLEPLLLDLELGGGRKVLVEISGRTQPILLDAAGSLVMLPSGLGAQGHLREQKEALKAFLDMAILAAQGRAIGPSHGALILSGNGSWSALSFSSFEKAEARAYLAAIVTDLLGGTHAYSLPVEAAIAHADQGVRSIHGYVEDAREKARASAMRSSVASADRPRWCPGPVAHPEDYPAPAEDEARAMLERRFAPYFQRRRRGLDKAVSR